ncbi:uncharacterized protein LOC108433876 [Pygocentrus nattereri]|uniref:Transmembrane protein 176l.2 n=1 Tax=Pygocentrus nattereri TaxID=42514 RepID=A0A3B4DE48_PYGNA|nr:uncharacterized protein LOC108433876 [Pygocentrus nattereri]
MSLTMTKAEGVTVFTVTSNPKSKWPLLCQLLGTLCWSPVCSVSQSLKQKIGRTHTVLGTLQILVGLMNVAFGCIFRSVGSFSYWPLLDSCFWLGAGFIAAGIVCILAEKFPSSCLLSFTILVNLVSVGLAITATVFYSVDLVWLPQRSECDQSYLYGNGYGYYRTTPSPEKKTLTEDCERKEYIVKLVNRGLDILLIVLAVLQLCVTVSSCVLILKTLCKKKKGDDMEDPELHKPLVEEVLSNPAC